MHKRKVQDVRQWLVEAYEGGPSGKLKKYRVRIRLFRSVVQYSQLTHCSAFLS